MKTRGRIARWTAVGGAALLALALLAVASAHARYDHSTPGQGQTVQTSPARVDIYTVQDMAKDSANTLITVTNANNTQVDTGDTMVDDSNRRHFSVGLKPNLPPGRYVVSFKNISDQDGEKDHGQFAFYVGAGPTAAQTALDKQLRITSQAEDTAAPAKSSSHTGLIVTIVIIVIIIVVIVAIAAWLAARRRRRL